MKDSEEKTPVLLRLLLIMKLCRHDNFVMIKALKVLSLFFALDALSHEFVHVKVASTIFCSYC